jgi:hypothetical protein
MRKGLLLLLFLCAHTLAASQPFPIGEQAIYKIKWGPITCGRMQMNCDLVQKDGTEQIRIRVTVKSGLLAGTLYPVDDQVDCYIDPATGLSTRLEKQTNEGGFICNDLLTIDRLKNQANWVSHSANITTNYPITAGALDAVSFLFAVRQADFTPDQPQDFDMVVDHAQQGITITAEQDTDRKKIADGDKVLCRKFSVKPKRDDLFVRKIPGEMWITEDARRILARMTLRTPAGWAKVILDEYRPPNSQPEEIATENTPTL